MRIAILAAALILGGLASRADAYAIKQGTAAKVMFKVYQTNSAAGLTGATLTIQITKPGVAFASGGGTIFENGNGWYTYTATTGETNTLGQFALYVTATGADPTDFAAEVVAYDPASAANLGLAALPSSGTVALASQIPSGFTSSLFVTPGVFATAALANTPTGGGGGSGVAVVTGTVSAALTPTLFTAALSANASGAAASYVGRKVLFQSGTANQQRGTILTAAVAGSPGSYLVTIVLNGNVTPALQITPAVGDTLVIY